MQPERVISKNYESYRPKLSVVYMRKYMNIYPIMCTYKSSPLTHFLYQ